MKPQQLYCGPGWHEQGIFILKYTSVPRAFGKLFIFNFLFSNNSKLLDEPGWYKLTFPFPFFLLCGGGICLPAPLFSQKQTLINFISLPAMKLIKIFFWGMFISFLGSLPLGTLNVAAMQIGIQENIPNAIWFVIGSLLVEMIYVRISLIGIDWVRKQQKLMRAMEWITLAIILALAVGSFIAATSEEGGAKNVLLNNNMHRFFLGMFMCAINPVQIPFWFGWSTVLFTKGVLQPKPSHYNSYIVGIGIGTLVGNCIFIFGGKWMVQRIASSEQYLNWVIGGIFALTALIQLIRIIRKKDAVSRLVKDKVPPGGSSIP